eukprot:5063690-Amphidinium_carterae.1
MKDCASQVQHLSQDLTKQTKQCSAGNGRNPVEKAHHQDMVLIARPLANCLCTQTCKLNVTHVLVKFRASMAEVPAVIETNASRGACGCAYRVRPGVHHSEFHWTGWVYYRSCAVNVAALRADLVHQLLSEHVSPMLLTLVAVTDPCWGPI